MERKVWPAPFLRALVALSASESTGSPGDDTLFSSDNGDVTMVNRLRSPECEPHQKS
jgi:hypothetical protein